MAACFLSALCSGCGGSTTQAPLGTPADPFAAIPSLADLALLPASDSRGVTRGVSQIDGTSTVARSGGGSYEEGSALAVVPGGGEDVAFAVYTQGGITADKPVQLDLTVEAASLTPGGQPDLPLVYWLGLSDYTTGRWEWIGPLTTSGVFTEALNDPTWFHRYVSAPDAANECRFNYVLLVTDSGNPGQPNAVKITSSDTTVSATYETNNPHFVDLQADVVTGGTPQGVRWPTTAGATRQASAAYQVRLSWTHVPPVDASDDRNIANHYDIFRQGPGNTPIEQIDTVAAPKASYYDPPAAGYPNGATQPPMVGADYIYYVQAVTATGESTEPFATRVLPLPTDPPDAALTGSFDEAAAPCTVQLDASTSVSGTGRNINGTETEWDLDGDGVFDEAGAEQGAHGSILASAVLPSPGTWRLQVKVFDNVGESDTAAFDVLLHTLDIATVETVGGSSTGGGIGPDHCLIVLPSGAPAIAYRDANQQNLKYAVVANPTDDGTQAADWTVVDVDSTTFDQFNISTSLAVVNGNPAIAYYFDRANGGTDIFKYAFSTTSLGSNANDWQKSELDTNAFVGSRCSLAEINGVPAVAYQDSNFGTEIHVKYAIAFTANPTSPTDWIAITLQSGNNVDNLVSSLANIGGFPTIVYENLGNGDLNYMRSATATGSSPADWTSVLLFARGGSGTFWKSSLLEVNGNPAIAWSDSTGLQYSRSSTTDGLLAADWVTVPTGAVSTEHASLALANGNPAIAWWDNTTHNCLGYSESSTVLGTSAADWHSFSAHSSPGGVLNPTLAFAHGQPVFALMFYDANGREIRYEALRD